MSRRQTKPMTPDERRQFALEFRAKHTKDTKPAPSQTTTAPAISPALARLYQTWREITPGCDDRPGVAEVREMVARRELLAPPPASYSDRPIRGKISF